MSDTAANEERWQALKGRRALVTGAAGFSGSALVRRLVGLGMEVNGLARPATPVDHLAELPVRWFRGDVFDEGLVRKAVQGVDLVFHMATTYRHGGASESDHRRVHVLGTQQVARAAAATRCCRRFVHVSTVGVHGHVEGPPAGEEAPFNPGDAYQQTKAEAEMWFRAFSQDNGLPFTIVRPVAIYGPGDRRLLKLFRLAAHRMAFLPGKPGCFYHLIHVRDFVELLALTAVHPLAENETFILGDPTAMLMEDIVRVIATSIGVSCRIVRVPVWPLEVAAGFCEWAAGWLRIEPPLHRRRVAFFTKSRAFDTSKLRKTLDYRFRSSTREGLAQTARWYVGHGWLKVGRRPGRLGVAEDDRGTGDAG